MTTTPAALSELKPCPFCRNGGKAGIRHSYDDDGLRWTWVECGTCHARTGGNWCRPENECPQFMQERRDEWNLRSRPNEGMAEALASLKPHSKWLHLVAERLHKQQRDYSIANTCEEAADAIDAAIALPAAVAPGERENEFTKGGGLSFEGATRTDDRGDRATEETGTDRPAVPISSPAPTETARGEEPEDAAKLAALLINLDDAVAHFEKEAAYEVENMGAGGSQIALGKWRRYIAAIWEARCFVALHGPNWRAIATLSAPSLEDNLSALKQAIREAKPAIEAADYYLVTATKFQTNEMRQKDLRGYAAQLRALAAIGELPA